MIMAATTPPPSPIPVSEGLHLIPLPQPIAGFDAFISSWLYSGEHRFLVDVGPSGTAPLLIACLHAAGIHTLDAILLTHIHIDHSGGIGEVAAAFPSAPIVCHARAAPHLVDPQKLWAFQQRDMLALSLDTKINMLRPYVERAGWVTEPAPREVDPLLGQIAAAAGDRIKVAGDILEYDEFFRDDQVLPYDEKAFEKRLRTGDAAVLLKKLRDRLELLDVFDAKHTEACLREFLEHEGVKIGGVIHALRVAVTGKSVGLGMFDTLAILGRESVLARIDRALAML